MHRACLQPCVSCDRRYQLHLRHHQAPAVISRYLSRYQPLEAVVGVLVRGLYSPWLCGCPYLVVGGMPTVKQLQAELKKRGLETKGKKAELEKRLAEDDAAKEAAAEAGGGGEVRAVSALDLYGRVAVNCMGGRQ